MNYTKEQLLGAIVTYTHDYRVVENGDDLQLQSIDNLGEFYGNYDYQRLCDNINRGACKIKSLKKIEYELY